VLLLYAVAIVTPVSRFADRSVLCQSS